MLMPPIYENWGNWEYEREEFRANIESKFYNLFLLAWLGGVGMSLWRSLRQHMGSKPAERFLREQVIYNVSKGAS